MCKLVYYKLLGVFLLLPSIMSTLSSLSSRSAVCFLTRRASLETTRFAQELAEKVTSIDVFILVDNNTNTTQPISSSLVRFLYFNETVGTKFGFRGANTFGSGKLCLAWDKALYYFARQSTHHSFVWFIEDDVFIPSVQAFLSLHELYSPSNDLVTSIVEYNVNGTLWGWRWWHLVDGKFVLPWAHGLVCAAGCSRRLLSAVDEFVQWQGQVAYIELLFHTLAIQDNKMKVVTPRELDTIVYRDKYSFERIQARPNNWWHPIKSFQQQAEFRNRLAKESVIDENKITTTLISIEKQLNSNTNTKSISILKNQMLALLTEFEGIKDQLTPSTRLRLRDRFLRLHTNESHHLNTIIQLLADHSFKLPQPGIDTIFKPDKSKMTIELEKALENNKQTILQLIKNDPRTEDEIKRISLLRDEAKLLINMITQELRCDEKDIQCNQANALFRLHLVNAKYYQRTLINDTFVISLIILCAMVIFIQLRKKGFGYFTRIH